MNESECISDADRLLIARASAEALAAARLEQFVSGHLAAVYGLKPGDRIEDNGRIVRAEAAD